MKRVHPDKDFIKNILHRVKSEDIHSMFVAFEVKTEAASTNGDILKKAFKTHHTYIKMHKYLRRTV